MSAQPLFFPQHFFYQYIVLTTSHFYFSIELLSRRFSKFCYDKKLILKDMSFSRSLQEDLKTHASKIILFLQCSFQFSKKHSMGKSDWVTVTSAQGSKICFRLKQTNKQKRCRAGTYSFIVGNYLSLSRSLP